MSTAKETIDYILDQLSGVPGVYERKMFGEYALYANNRVVALVCNDTLFVKVTEAGIEFIGGEYKTGPAYPGAKPSLVIDADQIEDHRWLCELITITAENVQLPKPKKKQVK